jgi:Flp pilus assembly protein TadD
MALALVVTVACSRRMETVHPVVPDSSSARGQARHTSGVPAVMDRQVRNAVDLGDGDIRVRRLRERVVRHPDDLKARLELASLYEESGYPELAVEHCRLAAARFPDDPGAVIGLARGLRAARQYGEAAKALSGWSAAHPGMKPQVAADLHSWAGILLDEQGRLSEAEAEFRAAGVQAPERDSIHNNLGYNLLLQGKSQEAAAEFRAALKLEPRSEIARNNLGLALAAADRGEAVMAWEAVSGPAAAHNNLAAVLMGQGKYDEARVELQRALGVQRDNRAALANVKLLGELSGGTKVELTDWPAATAGPQGRTGFWPRIGRGLKRALVGGPAANKENAGTPQPTTELSRAR